MKLYSKILLATAICFFVAGEPLGAASGPPAAGGKLPEIKLAAPQEAEQHLYLGVSGRQTFTIPEINAEIVLIEIFSMY